MEEFLRTEMLLGPGATESLCKKSVIIFGVGGVGSYAAEAIARSGVGKITLVDSDRVSLSNINRQLCALHSTVGRYKTEVTKERIIDINPLCSVTEINKFYLPENADEFEIEKYDYIIDAIDTVSAKLDLAKRAYDMGLNIISCMGTGNKLDPSKFEITDIYKTSVCPLCRVMRRELKARGVKELTVLYSPEEPVKTGERTPGSLPFVPGVAGLMIAGRAIMDLCIETAQKSD